MSLLCFLTIFLKKNHFSIIKKKKHETVLFRNSVFKRTIFVEIFFICETQRFKSRFKNLRIFEVMQNFCLKIRKKIKNDAKIFKVKKFARKKLSSELKGTKTRKVQVLLKKYIKKCIKNV